MSLRNKVNFLKNFKKFPQKSEIWYKERFNSITATDVAPILEANPYYSKTDILKKKLDRDNMLKEMNTEEVNQVMGWGNKYEPIAKNVYENFVNDKVYDVGLIKHKNYKWLGASPDGIRNCGRLLEIKCVWNRKIKNKTPYYYWIQVQIQLEVCDLDSCDFFQCKFMEYEDYLDYCKDDGYLKGEVDYEGKKYYWKLIEHSMETIQRDKNWFQNNFPIIFNFWETILYYRQNGQNIMEQDLKENNKRKLNDLLKSSDDNENLLKKNKLYLVDWTDWVQPNEIRNYLLNDTLLDWLKLYGGKYSFMEDRKIGINDYMQNKDQLFREAIEENLKLRFGYNFEHVAEPCHLYSTEKALETYKLMQKGVPIIFQPVLHNKENKTICMPDFLIRSDYVSSIFKEKMDWYDVYPLHYMVLNLKYLSLILKNNGEIYNSGNVIYHKCKLWMETEALNQLQKNKAKQGLFLGRKYKILKGKNKDSTYFNNCFGTFGIVKTDDIDLKSKVEGALNWLKDLKLNGKTWDISPPNNPALYPNMSNFSDYPWKSFKEELALKNKEITLINGLGVKDRKVLLENNIDRWDKINLELLNINPKKKEQIKRIIQVNNPTGRNKFLPKKIQMDNKYRGHKNVESGIHFYVDFETINEHHDDFNKIKSYRHQHPNFSELLSDIVFLIGVGYIEPETNEWIFKSFVVNKVNYVNEKIILKEFLDYMSSIRDKYKVIQSKKSYLYHWSFAEKTCYYRLIKKYNMTSPEYLQWVDLLDVFYSNPIGIKGVFNYGLKSVAKKMYEYKMITTNWVDNEQSGLSAKIIATNCHDNQDKNMTLKEMDGINEIIKYNEIDCLVMWDIQRYLLTKI